MTPGDWLAAALSNLRALPARYWLLLAIIFSGKAMVMFLPLETQQSGAMTITLSFASFLVMLWLPYVLMRVMAGEGSPARPTLAFVIFAVAAFLLSLVRSLPVLAAHRAFLDGIGITHAELIMFAAAILSAILAARFLPLYAGTATARLSPMEPWWWRGMNGVAAGFVGAVLIVTLARQTITMAVPIAMPNLTLGNILLSHVHAFTDAGILLFTLALAVGACNHCARLQGSAGPR